MDQHFNTRIQNKYDTYAQWTANNIIPKQGELCVVVVPASSGVIPQEPAVLFKVGDGTSHFNDLPFITAKAGDIYAWAKAENKPTYAASEIQNLTEFIKQQDTDTQYKIEASVENPRQFVLYVKSTGGDFVAQDTITIPDTIYTLVEGDTDGTVKFNDTNVPVHGLKSAAYKNASDFDSAGAADSKDTAIAAAQATADNHIANKENPHSVTAAQVGADPQGSADTALQTAKSYADEQIQTHNTAEDVHANKGWITSGSGLPSTPAKINADTLGGVPASGYAQAQHMQPIEQGGTNATSVEQARVNLGVEAKHISSTVTLTSSGWLDNSQMVNVSGMTAILDVVIGPVPDSYENWVKFGVYCSAQGEGTLTFICKKIPDTELTANLLILRG